MHLVFTATPPTSHIARPLRKIGITFKSHNVSSTTLKVNLPQPPKKLHIGRRSRIHDRLEYHHKNTTNGSEDVYKAGAGRRVARVVRLPFFVLIAHGKRQPVDSPLQVRPFPLLPAMLLLT